MAYNQSKTAAVSYKSLISTAVSCDNSLPLELLELIELRLETQLVISEYTAWQFFEDFNLCFAFEGLHSLWIVLLDSN